MSDCRSSIMNSNEVANPEGLQESVANAISFLKIYDWIHSTQVTHIFDGTLHRIPTEWIPFLRQLNTEELNNLPFLWQSSTQLYPTWPSSLHKFLDQASRLSINRDQAELKPIMLDHSTARGMNLKKMHEVSYIASLIHEVVTEADCDLIVDVGSGLGYLDHILNQVYCHAVLGLEMSESHLMGAESRAEKQGLQDGAVRNVKFQLINDMQCFKQLETLISTMGSELTSQNKMSTETVKEDYTDKEASAASEINSSPSPCVCLIGLHCCGDLTPTMLALFHHVPSIKAICCVSCCYHKMKLVSDHFHNFPLSNHCKKLYSHFMGEDLSWRILPQTLRLGAQETRSRWKVQSEEDHRNHTNHVAFRGLLELANCGDAAFKRKVVRKCDFSSVEAFLDTFFSSSSLSEAEISSAQSTLNDLHMKYQNDFYLIEIFTALQMIVQPVIESLIHHDRLLWLFEQGHSKIKVVPVFDETISPRNIATVVIK